MELRTCKNCRRLFNFISGAPLCPACREDLEKKFQQAKEYVRNNQGVTIRMVAEEIDVPESQVKEWVKDERLVFTNPDAAGISCEVCGTAIATGRYCDKCKIQVMRDLNNITAKPAAAPKKIIRDTTARMRFLDNR